MLFVPQAALQGLQNMSGSSFPKPESGDLSLSSSPVTSSHLYEAGIQGIQSLSRQASGAPSLKDEKGEAEDLSMSRRGSSQELPVLDYMEQPQDLRYIVKRLYPVMETV